MNMFNNRAPQGNQGFAINPFSDPSDGQNKNPSFKEKLNQKKPNPFNAEFDQIRPKQKNVGDFVNNSQMQESIYVDESETGLSWKDSPAASQLFTFKCRCGMSITSRAMLEKHSQECLQMQQDGFNQFVQVLHELTQNGDKNKINNMRAIFQMMMPSTGVRAVVQEEAKNSEDINMIDDQQISSLVDNNKFAPPYMEQQKVNVLNMEDFMDPAERQRAQTYYQQVKQQAEEKMCKFCEKQITEQDMANQMMTMLQTTDCFHQVHIDCLKEQTIKNWSENQEVNCPRCQVPVAQYELKQYLNDDEKGTIEKNQHMQIVKLNPSFVCCSCGNIMELIPGEVVKGQKDDKGNPVSKEAAVHMANNRIRCNECQKNFCASCNAEPYHTGKTCDENNAKSCRFCQRELKQPSPSMKQAFRDVCRDPDCFNLMQQSCDKVHKCGHPCCGSAGEKQCLPCLEEDCIKKMDPAIAPKKNKEEFCSICFCSGLGQEPCVQLECGHVFHLGCIKSQVQNQYNGPRIVFNYLDCPDCKQRIKAPHCPTLDKEIKKQQKLEELIVSKAIERAKFEDLHKNPRLKKPGDRFYNDLKSFALYKLSYYMCFKCSNPYFGGMKDCEAAQNDYNSFKKEELVCGKCAAVAVGGGIKDCKKHGQDFIEFKCKFCCSIAQWFCWGNTHFCEPCHKRQCNGDYVSRKPRDQLPKCKGPNDCPLKIKHPPNGEEYALGCSVCRNMQENAKDF